MTYVFIRTQRGTHTKTVIRHSKEAAIRGPRRERPQGFQTHWHVELGIPGSRTTTFTFSSLKTSHHTSEGKEFMLPFDLWMARHLQMCWPPLVKGLVSTNAAFLERVSDQKFSRSGNWARFQNTPVERAVPSYHPDLASLLHVRSSHSNPILVSEINTDPSIGCCSLDTVFGSEWW